MPVTPIRGTLSAVSAYPAIVHAQYRRVRTTA